MKIVVCVKQVPEVANVQVDPVTNTLIREGVQSILNPFCEYALDHAIRLAKANEGLEVITITMGPLQAREVLMRSMELGADSSILVTDRKFAGADTWATAYLVGKQAIDGDTAQVGPEMAEILALPQITYGVEISLGSNHKRIRVKREIEQGYEIIETTLPALVTFSKGEVVRRVPSLHDLIASHKKPIRIINANELDISENQLGLEGSYTQVVKVFPPQEKQNGRIMRNLEAEKAASEIFKFLRNSRFI
jgi:electron transfer flavoprotein alpha/beta subunit